MAELSTLGSVIKTAYEKQSNTNAFTDAQKSAVTSAVQPADLGPYAKTADLFSGNYDDLSGKPTIPAAVTSNGSLTNDAGYLTEHQSLAGYAKTADLFSGAYDDLTGKPTLGTASTKATGFFATAAQGAKADSATQPADLA